MLLVDVSGRQRLVVYCSDDRELQGQQGLSWLAVLGINPQQMHGLASRPSGVKVTEQHVHVSQLHVAWINWWDDKHLAVKHACALWTRK